MVSLHLELVEEVLEMSWDCDDIVRLLFSDDGCLLAASDISANVYLWDMQQKQVICSSRKPEFSEPYFREIADLFAISFSHNHVLLVASVTSRRNWLSVQSDEFLSVWRSDTQMISTYPGHRPYATGAAFSPDGTYLVTADREGTIRLWDLLSSKEVYSRSWEDDVQKTLKENERFARYDRLAFSPQASYLALSCGNTQQRTLQIWRADTLYSRFETVQTLSGLPPFYKLAFSPDETQLALLLNNNLPEQRRRETPWLLVYSIPSLSLLATISLPTAMARDQPTPTMRNFTFSPDNRYLALTLDNGTVWIWDFREQQFVYAMQAHDDIWEIEKEHGHAPFWGMDGIAWSSDGSLIATGGLCSTEPPFLSRVRLWRMDETPEMKQ